MPSDLEKWIIVERYNSRARRAIPGQPFPPPMTYEEVMAELIQEAFGYKPEPSRVTKSPEPERDTTFDYLPPIEQKFESEPEEIEQMFEPYKPPFVKSADLILAALKKGASLEQALDSMENYYKERNDGV